MKRIFTILIIIVICQTSVLSQKNVMDFQRAKENKIKQLLISKDCLQLDKKHNKQLKSSVIKRTNFNEDGGIVTVTHNECIGCGACVQSCPYDARYSHPEGYVDKCTFCLHRVKKGDQPACVSVCPTKCMYFGDLDDPNSDVSKALRHRKYKTLAPEAGTKPQIFYLT